VKPFAAELRRPGLRLKDAQQCSVRFTREAQDISSEVVIGQLLKHGMPAAVLFDEAEMSERGLHVQSPFSRAG